MNEKCLVIPNKITVSIVHVYIEWIRSPIQWENKEDTCSLWFNTHCQCIDELSFEKNFILKYWTTHTHVSSHMYINEFFSIKLYSLNG
jgi:hypothetical protein